MKDSFYLDSALRMEFDNYVDEISNLTHLKNKKVCALLDYGVVEDLQVDCEGRVKLPYKAKNVVIGLSYDFILETLNLESQSTIGTNKLINKVEVKILNSREDFFIKNDDGSVSQNSRSHESVNNPLKLFSKNVEFCPLASPSSEESVTIIQKFPLPINILAISATISVQEVEAQ